MADVETFKGLLGRTDGGARVHVVIELSRMDDGRARQTVEHADIYVYARLSISGSVTEKGCRNMSSGGQVISDARLVTKPAPGLTLADVGLLVTTWKRWHLNDMRGACAHQTPTGDTASERLDNTPPCPITGYKYGHAWLVDPLPRAITTTIRRLGGLLDGTVAQG